jgi:dTDP-4-dehydrorhamnose reductase
MVLGRGRPLREALNATAIVIPASKGRVAELEAENSELRQHAIDLTDPTLARELKRALHPDTVISPGAKEQLHHAFSAATAAIKRAVKKRKGSASGGMAARTAAAESEENSRRQKEAWARRKARGSKA